jgi:hypothetical protein
MRSLPEGRCDTIDAMTAFDLLLRGGTLIDGTGAAGRRADVGVLGDRILAIGDLSAVVEGGRRGGDRRLRSGRDAWVRGPARAFRWFRVPRRRAGQPPPPGLHDPAVRQLRRHAGAAHRGRSLARRAVARPNELDARGPPSASTSIGSRSSRSGRTSRSSSVTARSGVPCSDRTRARPPPTSSRRWSRQWMRRWTRARSGCRRGSSTRPESTRRPTRSRRWSPPPRAAGACTRRTCATSAMGCSSRSTRRSPRSAP